MESFKSDRSVGLIINGHRYEETVVKSGVPQESPVITILFAIYLSQVFQGGEKEVEGCIATSFVDDCGWLGVADSVE